MLLKTLLKHINEILPDRTAMEGDRIGLQVQSGREEVNNILVVLELNEEVITWAAREKCDCIITFHPLIYSPLTEILDDDRIGRYCYLLIKNSISLIAIHTNFDAFSEGTSKLLADRLGLKKIGFLVPDKELENHGMGVIATPARPMKPEALIRSVQNVCMSPIRYTEGKKDLLIKRIAIVGGSGTAFINEALLHGCDAFITADVTYHKFHQVNGRMWLIDPGHYEMEQFVPQGLANLLKNIIDNHNYNFIGVSSIHTNPVRYYPDNEKYIFKQSQYLNNI